MTQPEVATIWATVENSSHPEYGVAMIPFPIPRDCYDRYMENRRIATGDIIAGPFFIIGNGGEDFRSLTDAEINKYVQEYAQPMEISQEEVQANMGWEFHVF